MARYIRDIVLNKPDDFVAFMMNDYLQKNGFSPSDWKGEPAFRAGDAMLEGKGFIQTLLFYLITRVSHNTLLISVPIPIFLGFSFIIEFFSSSQPDFKLG